MFLSSLATAVTTPDIRTGFSPEGSGRSLVLNTINNAQKSIRMMAYKFTDPDVMKALIAARRRGGDVKIVIDDKGNYGKANRAAMNLVVNAGIPLKTDSYFPIQHDKVIVVDAQTVATGSYNFTRAAATRNSENVIVVRFVPEIARQYLKHRESR